MKSFTRYVSPLGGGGGLTCYEALRKNIGWMCLDSAVT